MLGNGLEEIVRVPLRLVLLLCSLCAAMGGTGAQAQAEREARPPPPPPPHTLTPEQEARLMARRERLRMLREEMLRDMQRMERGMPPGAGPGAPPPYSAGGEERGWRWRRGVAGEPPHPRPPPQPRNGGVQPALQPQDGAAEGREPPPPNRLSPEERKQLRRQMRDAAREVYGE